MGARNFTELGLRVVKVDAERNLLFLRGAVPGPMNGLLTVRKQGGPSRHDEAPAYSAGRAKKKAVRPPGALVDGTGNGHAPQRPRGNLPADPPPGTRGPQARE